MKKQREGEIATALGSSLARERAKAGMTQQGAAEALGTVMEMISRIERGKVLPSIPRLIEFAELYNCSASQLIGSISDAKQDHEVQLQELMPTDNKDARQLIVDVSKLIVSFAEKK